MNLRLRAKLGFGGGSVVESGPPSATVQIPQFGVDVAFTPPTVVAQRVAVTAIPQFGVNVAFTAPTVTAGGGGTTETFTEPFTANDGVFSTLAGTPTWTTGRMAFNAIGEGIVKTNSCVRGFSLSLDLQVNQPPADEANMVVVKFLSGANNYSFHFVTSVDAEDVPTFLYFIQKNGVEIDTIGGVINFGGEDRFHIHLEVGGNLLIKNSALTTLLTVSDNTYTSFDTIQIYKDGSTTDTVFVDDVAVATL